jgi:signal peptidase I
MSDDPHGPAEGPPSHEPTGAPEPPPIDDERLRDADLTAPDADRRSPEARGEHIDPWRWQHGGYRDDRYSDIPAALELSYTPTDLGLSPRAYERAFPYEKRHGYATSARLRKVGRELVETIILAALIFLAVRAVVQNFRVEGASMQPSLNDREYLLVNKAIYFRVDMDQIHRFLPFVPGDGADGDRHLFRAPRRGDVIVFKFHLDTKRDFIKRVIGVPGDTVEVRDGTVFINGQPLQEDYVLDTPNYTYGPKTVPEGHYFVLGDNRRNSFDSHSWGSSCPPQQQCDFVPEENIIGQAWLLYWPFHDLGFVNNKTLRPVAP